MFFILPFKEDIIIDNTDINVWLDPILGNDNESLLVQDTTDMIVENVSIKTIREIIKRHLAKFPQLELKRKELYLSDNYCSICGVLPTVFTDKKRNRKFYIKASQKSRKEFNSVFDDYIRKMNISFEDGENRLDYTACSFRITCSTLSVTFTVTIQGIVDNVFNRVATGLFINNKFICYLSEEFGYFKDEVDILAVQFIKECSGYALTLLSPSTSKFIVVKMSRVLKLITIERLDSVIDKDYYNKFNT